jgi:3-methylcrotonyl-CoA carboxylase alpha subunit
LHLLHRALAETDLVGVASNIDLLGRIVLHPEFMAGAVDTGFIARHSDELLAALPVPSYEVRAIAALCVLNDEAEIATTAAATSGDPHSPWHTRDHWWLNMPLTRELRLQFDGNPCPVSVQHTGATWRLTIDDRSCNASIRRAGDGRLDVTLDGTRTRLFATRQAETIIVRHGGNTYSFRLPDLIAAAGDDDDTGGRLIAPIPGQVTQVLAEPGMSVTRGQVMVVLEAMKTVFRLTAPADGIVATVSCQAGDSVVEGQLLVAFADDAQPAPPG